MITPKQAAEASAKYYRDLTDSTGTLLVEEIEKSSDKKKWYVTLSHPNNDAMRGNLGLLYGSQSEMRAYKLFNVDATTGEVASMKVKKII